jgi:DNA-binding response OmpR family regulator
VLLIDKDAAFRANLTIALAHAGHEVESAGSGEAGIALARTSRPDVVIFEFRQPDMDGVALCQSLRAEHPAPPLLCILSSSSDEADRVAAFEAGVDDYVTKPHSNRELLLRLRSLARRRSMRPRDRDVLRVACLSVDRAARRVDVDGTPIELTRREFDLLVQFAEQPGAIHSREALLSSVWHETTFSGRVVDTTIKRLRQKLGKRSPPITTVRALGYKLSAE